MTKLVKCTSLFEKEMFAPKKKGGKKLNNPEGGKC
jgi:hypothetical protein